MADDERVDLLLDLQIIIQDILKGSDDVTLEEREAIKEYVRTNGLEAIFLSPDEVPYPDEDEEEYECDEEDEEGDEEDEYAGFGSYGDMFLTSRDAKKLDNGEMVKISPYALGSYVIGKVEKAQKVGDLQSVLDQCLAMEAQYSGCSAEDVSKKISSFIGDLYYAMGNFDNAFERYLEIYRSSPGEQELIQLLNACHKAKKQPPPECMLRFGWCSIGLSEIPESYNEYIMRRFETERKHQGGDFFAWAMREGTANDHYSVGVFSSMSYVSSEKMRKRFKIKPFTNFTLLRPVSDFSKLVASETKAIFKMQSEFKEDGLILHQWFEKLEWLEAFYSAFPDEEIVFAYHTPWLWKFNFDLFFPARQLAIVFHTPEDRNANEFVNGAAGQVQLTKEWSRVVKKADKSYGIRVVHVPANSDKSCVSHILNRCESDCRVI